MELENYLYPLRRWWWILVLATILAAGSSYYVVSNQPAVFASRTTLAVGSTIAAPNPSSADLALAGQLAQLYADLARRQPVRADTRAALGLNRLPDIVVRVASNNAQLIEIVVTDTNPVRAAVVANEMANQLILRSPSNPDDEFQQRQAFVRDQLNYLETKISETQVEIVRKQDELAELVSARQIADVQTEINALQGKLGSLQTIYSSLLSNASSQSVNTLAVIEPAVEPSGSISSSPQYLVLVAGAIGFSLAAGAAYLLEYMDKTLKSPEDAERLLALPVLGHIGELSSTKEGRKRTHKIIFEGGDLRGIEAFHILRTNLQFSSVDEPLRAILVASPGPEDGKTTVAVNLALIMAKTGKKTLLLDADIRRPSIHHFFGLPNKRGLTDLCVGDLEPSDVATWELPPEVRPPTRPNCWHRSGWMKPSGN